MVQFITDEGPVYCALFSGLFALHHPETETLEVYTPKGTVAMVGPGTAELRELFCSNQATMIRTDGAKIVSVTFLSKDEAEANADVAAANGVDLNVNEGQPGW
jgi:hypothetical protein